MSDNYSKKSLRSSSLTAIVSISLVLFMLGLLGLIILNSKKISDHVKENIGFQVILKDKLQDADIDHVRSKIDSYQYVKSTEYVSKEQAAKSLQEDLGEDFISFLGYNPLLPSITVHLKAAYTNSDSLLWIEKNLLKYSQVKEINYQKSLVSMVNENAKKISLVILAFSTLLMLIALALINNTIRLTIYSKRFLIKTMQLVGATQGFIRRPFIFKGIKHGIYGAIIAIALLIGVLYFAERQLPELEALQDIELLAKLFGIVLLAGIIISWISTSMAVRKYLRLKADELYY